MVVDVVELIGYCHSVQLRRPMKRQAPARCTRAASVTVGWLQSYTMISVWMPARCTSTASVVVAWLQPPMISV